MIDNQIMSSEISVIQRGWLDAAATIAPHVEGLAAFLENNIALLNADNRLDEANLLAVVAEAGSFVEAAGADDIANQLSRRLRRTVYEYLLALDAAHDGPNDSGAVHDAPIRNATSTAAAVADRGTFLIGADEVAALIRPEDNVDSPMNVAVGEGGVVDVTPYSALADAVAAVIGDDPRDDVDTDAPNTKADAAYAEALEAATARHNPTTTPSAELLDTDDVPDADVDAARDDETMTANAAPTSEVAKRRFGIFRRSRGHSESDAVTAESDEPTSGWDIPSTVASSDDLSDPTSTADAAAVEFHPPANAEVAAPEASEPTAVTAEPEPDVLESPVAAMASQAPAAAGDALVIMPRDGFHLGDPNSAAATLAEEDERPARPTSVSFATDDYVSADPSVDLTDQRRKIDEKLRRKKCDEAGALLQQLAQEIGGREVAELSLDAGDRCRALGKRQAATNCYLAASRADPVYEAPWARLADVCIDDHDIDLAVSYLERVARLSRLRGDIRSSLRIYRKIVTIAPHREDILEMLMRAQTTGRMEP